MLSLISEAQEIEMGREYSEQIAATIAERHTPPSRRNALSTTAVSAPSSSGFDSSSTTAASVVCTVIPRPSQLSQAPTWLLKLKCRGVSTASKTTPCVTHEGVC